MGWKVEEEWRFAPSKNVNKPEEFNGFEKWKEVTILFEQLKKEYPNRFYLVKYEDLLQDTLNTIIKLFAFVELELTPQTKIFLKDSRKSSNKDAYSVFKKKESDEAWKGNLPEYIVKEIQKQLRNTHLQKY